MATMIAEFIYKEKGMTDIVVRQRGWSSTFRFYYIVPQRYPHGICYTLAWASPSNINQASYKGSLT